eukprot:gnl/TRDRNA2_/TRDRNA2_139457_c0_seq1.p1 gnl/TRDRNA2_/TRDRNA2_139457_c0~~gnl/TRDRNA2_/TRDRNA2_139457_c0_seq1.p1  ORF type:complete len:328 (+),score=47.23 gnl/TRDRNA2_/TRDRNA2_139457_c0_seq1:139-984(+)
MWLEARDLNQAASQSLIRALDRKSANSLSALLKLDLSNTRLSGAASSIVKTVRACHSLRALDLSRTRLGDVGAEQIVRGMTFDACGAGGPHQALRLLALKENGLTAAAAEAVAQAVSVVPLKKLFLAHNEFGDQGAKLLAAALEPGTPSACRRHLDGSSLEQLELSYNRLTVAGLAALLRPLAGCKSSLKSLDVGGNDRVGTSWMMAPESVMEVSESLHVAESLRELHLFRCGIHDDAYRLLLEALPQSLGLLNLATNPLSTALRNQLLREYGRNAGVVSI